MAQQIQTYAITAPGFYGLNTQDSSLDLASGFALVAKNCVIDQFGRVGARQGWTTQHAVNATLGSNDIAAIGELVTDSGLKYVAAAGNLKLFKLASNVLTELTYGGGGTAPAITANNWQIVALNECLYFFQLGHVPLIFDPNLSTTQYRRISEKPGYSGTVPSGNTVIAAAGRLWVADTANNKVTVTFSDILAGHLWSGGTSGSLNVSQVWPNGADNIVAMGSHNGFFFIFGSNNILVYANIGSPASLSLSDSVTGIGCIARDSVQNTGSDIIFLSNTGVRSVLRTIQEKSAPFRDISKNVRNDLTNAVAGEVVSTIKSIYSPVDSFYLLTLPVLQQVYCFDMKATLQDGSARVTIWNSIRPRSFCYTSDRKLLIGQPGYVGKYGSYTDNTVSYRFQYFTNHTDLGVPSVTSILKKLSVVVIGGTNQFVTLKWGYDFSSNYQAQNALIKAQGISEYGVAEYGIASYAAGVLLATLVAYPTGSGKIIQTGYEADIQGAPLSIQKIEIHAKNGKIV